MNTMRRKGIGAGDMDEQRTQLGVPGCARLVKVFFLLISLIGLGAWGGDTFAATCTSTGTGNWNAAATWSCVGLPAAAVPGAADAVVIANANPPHTVTVNVNSAALSVTITGGNRNGTLNLGPGITLNVTNAVTINAPTNSGAGRNTKSLNVGSGTLTAASISITSGNVAARISAVTVSTGTITTTGSITFAGTAAAAQLTSTGASTINIGGNLSNGGTFTSGTGTINFNGAAAQSIGVYTYNNVTINKSAGTATLLGATSMTGALTITSGTFANGAFALNVAGNFAQNGTFTAGAGVVTLNGGAAVQTISGTGPLGFANLTVNNTGGITLARNVTVTSAIIGAVTLTSTCPIDYTLTSNAGATVQHSCPLDHILITHAGSALTCSPQTVTITACANAACATLFTGGTSVTLTPGGQSFAIGVTGINSAATVQQSTAGAATMNAVSVPAAINAATCWNTATLTASCAMTFNDSGFLVTVPNHVSCNNATVTIEAVQTAPGTGRCVPAYQNVTRAVNLYSSYVSPATGTQVVTASTGVVSTAAPGTAHNLAFDVNGTATITLSYPDAGQLTLAAGDTAPTGAAMTGSGSFVVAPASFVFSGIPAAPLTAGQPFNATVTAMNACGIPAATPNFNGTVTITSSNPQPGLGNATAINTTLSGFINGVASKNLTWDEVGTIDLNANLANYLGSALSINGTQAGVGHRFHPAYFNTVVTQGCSTFTYAGTTAPVKAGQPFTVTVTANKAGGGITANYAGAANAYLTTLSNAGVTTGFASNTIAAASFANGVGSANVTYEVATPQTVLLTLALRAIDNDTPAVSSSGHTEGTTEIRSGRARISNAHGSELLALPVPFRAEYWNNGWVLNSADSCSGDGLLGGAVSVTLATVLPAAWTTCVQDSGSPGLSGAGCAAAGPAGQRFKEGGVVGFAGNFNLWLKAPGAGNTGAVTVTGYVPAWLQYPWSGGAAINPTGRATFGVYKGGDEFIYQRENY